MSKHGKQYTVLLNATARCDARGEIIGVVGVGQDITELKQVMAEAKRVVDDLTRLIDTANAPIFGIDIYGKVPPSPLPCRNLPPPPVGAAPLPPDRKSVV